MLPFSTGVKAPVFFSSGKSSIVIFSDLFFFNSLQSNDFSFLHRDFYSFYPIFKYMTMCDILLGKMSIDDINYMRNCIVFADFKNLSNRHRIVINIIINFQRWIDII